MRQTFLKWVIFAIAFISTTFLSIVWYAAWTSLTATIPTQQNNDTLNASIWNNLVAKVNSLIDNTNDINTRITTFPIFSANLNQARSSTINTWTKVPFNAKEFDTSNAFDTTNSRFQPTQAGYYNISLTVTFYWVWTWWSTYYVSLYKNGNAYKWDLNLINRTGWFYQSLNVDTDVYMNWTTDYLEWYYFWNGGTATLQQWGLQTRISGHYLRP